MFESKLLTIMSVPRKDEPRVEGVTAYQ